MLLIEQNTQVALSAAQYGYVLERGTMVLEGEAAVLKGRRSHKTGLSGPLKERRKKWDPGW